MALTRNEIAKRYRERHPERAKAAIRSWTLKNPDKIRMLHRRYEKAHPDKIKEQTARFRASNYGKATQLYYSAKNRAAIKGIPFEITRDYICDILDIGLCQVTGIPFTTSMPGRKPFAPSIDRTDSSKGYTKENVKIVIWIYNTAKAEFAHSDVVKMARALVDMEGKEQ